MRVALSRRSPTRTCAARRVETINALVSRPVPLIVISPWAKHGFVDHTQYETVSLLAFIEKLYNVPALGTRDAAANPFGNVFDFTQANPFAVKRAPAAARPKTH